MRFNVCCRTLFEREIGIRSAVSYSPAKNTLLYNLSSDAFHSYDYRNDYCINPPFCLNFNNVETNGHILAVGDERGYVRFFDAQKQICASSYSQKVDASAIMNWQTHHNCIFDLVWGHDDKKMITASGDQTARVWETETQVKLAEFSSHQGSVKIVRNSPFCSDIFATGSRDGHVMIWDIRTCHEVQQPCKSLRNIHCKQSYKRKRKLEQNSNQSVTCVEFGRSDYDIITAGAVDGRVKHWDLRKPNACVREYSHSSASGRDYGISSIAIDQTRRRIYVNAINNRIYLYDYLNPVEAPLATFDGHANNSFYVKLALSPDNDYLVSGSSDTRAYIWEVNSGNDPLLVLRGHEAEVCGVAWCSNDFGKLATCGDNEIVRVWSINKTIDNGLEKGLQRIHRGFATSFCKQWEAPESPFFPPEPPRNATPKTRPQRTLLDFWKANHPTSSDLE